jgi:hypothetical protein
MLHAAQRLVSRLLASTPTRHSVNRKLHFLVLINDFPGAIAKRIENRPVHLSDAYNNLAIRAGGKMITVALPSLTSRSDLSKVANFSPPEPCSGFPL